MVYWRKRSNASRALFWGELNHQRAGLPAVKSSFGFLEGTECRVWIKMEYAHDGAAIMVAGWHGVYIATFPPTTTHSVPGHSSHTLHDVRFKHRSWPQPIGHIWSKSRYVTLYAKVVAKDGLCACIALCIFTHALGYAKLYKAFGHSLQSGVLVLFGLVLRSCSCILVAKIQKIA